MVFMCNSTVEMTEWNATICFLESGSHWSFLIQHTVYELSQLSLLWEYVQTLQRSCPLLDVDSNTTTSDCKNRNSCNRLLWQKTFWHVTAGRALWIHFNCFDCGRGPSNGTFNSLIHRVLTVGSSLDHLNWSTRCWITKALSTSPANLSCLYILLTISVDVFLMCFEPRFTHITPLKYDVINSGKRRHYPLPFNFRKPDRWLFRESFYFQSQHLFLCMKNLSTLADVAHQRSWWRNAIHIFATRTHWHSFHWCEDAVATGNKWRSGVAVVKEKLMP